MLKQSDPKVQQYTEIQFTALPHRFFLRFKDTSYELPWNHVIWYEMDRGSWIIHNQGDSDEIERAYQLWLKQL